VESAVTEIVEKSGRVDILINGAGGNKPGATVMPEQSVSDVSIEDFKKVNDLNLLGTVIPTVAFNKLTMSLIVDLYICILIHLCTTIKLS